MRLVQVFCKIILLISSFYLLACNEASQPLGVRKPGGNDNKPTPPPRCSPSLLAQLYWNADKTAFGYTVEIGTQEGVYTSTYTLNPDEKLFVKAFNRETVYYVRVSKYLNLGDYQFQTFQVYGPSCANREAYQKQHSSYKEPFYQFITWTNK
ncbi:MAG: hypothetical protein ACXVCP_06040 [Bdellovibrio sp.]